MNVPTEQEAQHEMTAYVRKVEFVCKDLDVNQSLQYLTEDKLRKDMSFTEMQALAAEATKVLRKKGYVTSLAYIPAQDIKMGILKINVFIGRYGDIEINNHSQMTDQRLLGYTYAVRPGKLVKAQELDKSLLILNEIPGMEVKARMEPGTKKGTAKIIIDADTLEKQGGYVYNVANGQEAAIKAAANTKDSSNRTTNVGSYKNTNGEDNGLLTVGISGIQDIMKNYDVTYNTAMNVTPADFTYTSDHTEYWQGTPIPAQTGKVTNRFGEDVSDLVGKTTWDTPADTYTPGIYPIWGHGANDFTGNYNPLQSTNPNNAKALKIKNRPADRHTDEVQAFGLVRRPMLDIRYLELVGTEGVNRWISTNDLGTKSTTTLYDKKKTMKYQF